MKKIILFTVSLVSAGVTMAQPDAALNGQKTKSPVFTIEKSIAATSVKNQAMTGTCWCFSSTSLIESQCLKKNLGEYDLSEMFTVRNIYVEKAVNYVLRQGHAQFGEGGLGHDLIRAIATYGAVPESVYSGLKPGQKMHNHVKLEESLQKYLDSILKLHPVPPNWREGYENILDSSLGKPPVDFEYQEKKYTPKTFASELLKFNPDEYVNITSFTHHPYYQPFIIEVPDNFSNGAYYNLPLDEMIKLTKDALSGGYSVLWDADVSNNGFMQGKGVAVYFGTDKKDPNYKNDVINGTAAEGEWNAQKRQELFENLTTQDDHLMHITGLEKSAQGKTYFLVKNSWGDIGPNHGYINVSEGYFAINTISLIIPKAAFSKELRSRLGIK
jgi:bleomycin hydrolase